MPFAVTHILFPVILVDLFRDYLTKHKKRFTLFTILLAGIGSLLPDMDIPINLILNALGYSFDILKHRALTHAPLFGLVFLIPAIYFWYSKKPKKKISIYFSVFSFGILSHIFLDFLVSNGISGVMLLWPLSSKVFGLPLAYGLSERGMVNLYAAIDALLFLGWLIHEEVKHKIKDFI